MHDDLHKSASVGDALALIDEAAKVLDRASAVLFTRYEHTTVRELVGDRHVTDEEREAVARALPLLAALSPAKPATEPARSVVLALDLLENERSDAAALARVHLRAVLSSLTVLPR